MTPLILINFLFFSYSLNETFTGVPQTINKDAVSSIHTDSIPTWVRHLYEINKNEFMNDAIPVVTFFKILSDSTSYCLYKVDDGVCQITFVATQKNKKTYKRFKIGNECDEDFANPIYSQASYEHDSVKRSIIVTTDVEKAKSKYLIKDKDRFVFKNGYNMENAETANYSISKTILIDLSGNIITKNKNTR